MGVTIITPTRDRPYAFALCERWMRRQTLAWDQWLVIDDGDEPAVPTCGQQHIRRAPSAQRNTLPQNMLEALKHIRGDRVVMVEDDEYYAPTYVEAVVRGLDMRPLAGERHARYYNVQDRRWSEKTPNDTKHCSLARTGFRVELIPRMEQAATICLEQDIVFVDLYFWGERGPIPRIVHQNVSGQQALSVGIKGMPGRGGLGSGHRPGALPHHDPHGTKLIEWIGRTDANVYLAPSWARSWEERRTK